MSIITSLKRFYADIYRYKDYTYYYIKALQKSRVSNTSLGFIWWFLDPLLNMAIYIVLVRIAFQQRDPSYPVFFFSAMLVWRYFSMALQQATVSISSNLSISKDNYIPKFIFPLALCVSNLLPFLFSLLFLFFLNLVLGIPLTINLIYLPILLISLFLITCTFSFICAHINIFMNDFSNILPHILMVGMFVTPIFYDISRIPNEYSIIMKLNPLAILTTSFRNIFVYGIAPPTKQLIYLLIITVFLLALSIHTLYKYDKVYNRIGR